jgi:Dual specificity phosphatase, catalytic domain
MKSDHFRSATVAANYHRVTEFRATLKSQEKMCRFPGEKLTYAQILPNLFIGSHPRTIDDIDRLRREAGITAVLNIHTDDDMRSVDLDFPPLEAHYKACSIVLRRTPMVEEQVELRAKLYNSVQALSLLLAEGHTVYLHCTAGIGRAPTVAIGYLHTCLGWGLDDAINHVKLARQCAPHVEALRLALADQAAGDESVADRSL